MEDEGRECELIWIKWMRIRVFIWNWCEWGTWGTENKGDNLCGVDELRVMRKA